MKNIVYSRVFAAFGIVAAVSCAKDIVPVEEKPAEGDKPAVEVPAKVFTAGFETMETRSTLENYTPKWVEGDAIGVTTADDANVECTLVDAAKGTFSAEAVNGTAPFRAVYPYAAENTFEGDVLTAVVPSEQQLAKGQKVAPGALVAACKSANTTLSFKNCVSLMQVTVPAGIKSIVIEATKEGEKLSGKFTMDLAAETLAPVAAEDASASVTLKPEGESFETGTYYVSVIPGKISEIAITFTNTSGETVSVTKKAATTFVRSNGLDLGAFFTYEIGTAEELIKWARQSAKFTAWDVVTLKNDIALSAEQAARYVEANNFYGEFNGNSHTISGLTCPLFGNLQSAYVHDLKLSANITTDGKNSAQIKGINYGIGILGHYAYPKGNVAAATRENPEIKNVEVSGSITISGLNMAHQFYLGGVLGASNNVPLTSCTNNANVTLASGQTTSEMIGVGGVAGATQAGKNVNLTNCINNGAVTMSGTAKATPSIGGVVGHNTQDVIYNGCKNTGTVKLTSKGSSTGASATGGILGKSTNGLKMKACENSGEIQFIPADAAYVIIGGLVGSAQTDAFVASDSENKGKITFSSAATNRVDIGGVLGITEGKGNGYFIQNVQNSGEINVTCADITSKSDQFRIGGLVGNFSAGGTLGKDSVGSDTPCYNTGNIIVNSSQKKDIRVSGCVGCGVIPANTSYTSNFYNLHNSGNIDVTVAGATCTNLSCGGVVGYIGNNDYTIDSCESNSNLTSAGTITNNNIAVILGWSYADGTKTKVISNCGVGGSINGTETTEENMNDYVYKKASSAPTVSGTALVK